MIGRYRRYEISSGAIKPGQKDKPNRGHIMIPSKDITHKGGCHCGAVSFEFMGPPTTKITQCNCSICRLTDYQHVFVMQDDFTLITGEEALSEYRFGSGQAVHLFCKYCGVKAFYRPRSHPDKFSVNFRAVTSESLSITETISFDGQNWEKNIKALKAQT